MLQYHRRLKVLPKVSMYCPWFLFSMLVKFYLGFRVQHTVQYIHILRKIILNSSWSRLRIFILFLLSSGFFSTQGYPWAEYSAFQRTEKFPEFLEFIRDPGNECTYSRYPARRCNFTKSKLFKNSKVTCKSLLNPLLEISVLVSETNLYVRSPVEYWGPS